MSRLTKRLENGVVKRADVDDTNRGESIQTRLVTIEDILHAPDGTERITLDRLRELVAANNKIHTVISKAEGPQAQKYKQALLAALSKLTQAAEALS